MATNYVVLRDEKNIHDSRLLTASLNAAGDVVIEGRDWGDKVEKLLGEREYEWVWTIASADVPRLRHALGTTSNVLLALQTQFSGDKSGDLVAFLEAQAIPLKYWSRLGD